MERFNSTVGSARDLLAAWDSADSHRLQAAIDQVCSGQSRASDLERAELLEEIGCTMRAWMEGQKTTEDLDACLSLLRHLAVRSTLAAYSASSI